MAKGKALSIPYTTVELEGESWKIPVVRTGAHLQEKHVRDLVAPILYLFTSNSYTLKNCCEAVGINRRTFYNWKAKFAWVAEDYAEASRRRSAMFRSELREIARSNFLRLAGGYTVEVTEAEAEADVGAGGEEEMRTKRMKRKEIYVKPNARLIELAIVNLDGEHFQRNPKPDFGSDNIPDDISIDPITWVE